MKTKHTPGPWHRNIPPASHYPTIFAGRNKHVAVIKTDGMTPREIEANCDLVTAAPELVAALEGLVRRMESEMKRFPIVEQQKRRAYISTARAALAKAGRGVEGGGEATL